LQRPFGRLDIVHLFAYEASVLAGELVDYRQRTAEDGMIWVSWPKRSSKVPTDVTEDVIRQGLRGLICGTRRDIEGEARFFLREAEEGVPRRTRFGMSERSS
jgi:hypothetical protein